MTANAFEEDKREAIAAGMNGHIAKPIELDKLLSMLAEVIRQQENC
jgi:CheY-like chemotaxis protein